MHGVLCVHEGRGARLVVGPGVTLCSAHRQLGSQPEPESHIVITCSVRSGSARGEEQWPVRLVTTYQAEKSCDKCGSNMFEMQYECVTLCGNLLQFMQIMTKTSSQGINGDLIQIYLHESRSYLLNDELRGGHHSLYQHFYVDTVQVDDISNLTLF